MKKIYSKAHKLSSNNKTLILNSEYCGCFYCIKIFNYNDIDEWILGSVDDTALCPYCQVDSVIPSSQLYQLDILFLEKMYEVWF